MKKRYHFVVAYIIFIIILGIYISSTLKPETLGEIHKSIYNFFDYYSNIIETNMNEITISNDKGNWLELKEININDEPLINTYNLLVSDIKTCYLLSVDIENEVYNNIKALSFRNETNVTNEELSALNKRGSCLKNFDKYNSLVLSNDQQLSTKIKKQISIIVDYKPEPYTYKQFSDLLYDELVILSKMASLTKWLKVEYDTYTQ